MAIQNSEIDLESKINNAKIAYESNLVNNFWFNNSSIIYSHIRNITKTKSIPSIITFDGKQACEDSDKANLFNNYFHSVFTSPNNVESLNIDLLPNIPNSLSAIDISEAEVYITLSNLDPKKSVGADKIGPMILNSCSDVLSKPLYHLYSMSLRYATIPCSWKLHKIIPVFKSGNRNSVKCYRPISLLSNVSKVLEHLVYSKVVTKITDTISNSQFGFLQNPYSNSYILQMNFSLAPLKLTLLTLIYGRHLIQYLITSFL